MTRARGFTLLESLVALVVLSLGLLGAWALLLTSLRGHADAHRYAAATQLARDMVDRIRANPRAGAAYATADGIPPDIRCDPAPCEASQRAAADRGYFLRAAQALLPGEATAAIDYEPATGPAATDRYAVTLRWRGTRDDVRVTLQLLAPPVAG